MDKKRRAVPESDSSTGGDSDASETELEDASAASSNWSLLASIWPVSERPANLRRKEVVNAIDFNNLLAMAKFQKDTTSSATSSSGKASFTKDTLPGTTTFKEGKDDGVRKFHPARFLRLPLSNPKKWWNKVPLTREHKYRNIPLKFTGCQGQVSEKTIENAHDRSNAHQLKHFFSENIAINSKPFKKIERKDGDGLSTITDYLWEDPSNLSQCQDAMLNFQAVQQQLWPMDPTPTILLKVLTKYKWIQNGDSLKDKVAAATAFFNALMRENAGRAVRGETVMSFTEQELLMKDTLTSHGISCAVPIIRIPKFDPPAHNSKKVNDTRSSSNFNSSRKPSGGGGKFQTAKVGGNACCYAFNDVGGCHSNTQQRNGCKDSSGREFAHYCNLFVQASQAHCLKPHPRHKHV